MKTVVVSLTGVNFSHRFVLKELSLYFPTNQTYRHYFFDRPFNLQLSAADRQTDWYTRVVLKGIGVNERIPGSITYTAHRDILSGLGTDHQILCAGHVSNKFLTDLLPYADIIDIQDYSDFKFPSYLPDANCGKSVGHSGRNCSLAKLNYLRWFAEKSNMV